MALTENQAIQQLLDNPAAFTTKESLLGLVNQLSVEASGKVTVLYSGSLGQDAFGKSVSAGAVIENLVGRGADIRVVDKTEAAKFLNNEVFRETVQRVTGSLLKDEGSAANDFLYNAKEGAWAKASENFVKATTGEVITWTPNASSSRTFAQVEAALALADDSKITAINGRSIDAWRAEYASAGKNADALAKMVNGMNASSAEMLLDSNIRVVTGAGGSVVGVDTGNFFQRWGASAPSGWLANGSGESLNTMVMRGTDASRWALWEQGRELLQQLDEIPGAHAAGTVARRGLPFLGLALAAIDANAAYESGDVEGAKRIMADAAAETLGSIAGEIALGVLVGGALVVAGVGAVPAAIIGVTTAVVGGYLGGEAASRLMDYAREGLAGMGIDLGIGAPAPTIEPPHNLPTFDLTVDPANLRPEASSGLGSSTAGQGLLQSGTGWQAEMPNEFANLDGLRHVSGSALVADMTRPGNHSIHDLQAQMNALRSTIFASAQVEVVTSSQFSAVLPEGTSSSVAGVSVRLSGGTYGSEGIGFTGTLHKDALGRVVGMTPDANAGLVLQDAQGIAYVADGKLSLQYTSVATNPDGSFTATGWFVLSPAQTGATLQIVAAQKTTAYTDPVALDSEGDGIRLGAIPVRFDLDGDGSAESLPWTASTDPLLVMDLDGNGRIDSGRELVDLTDTQAPVNLLSLDDNGDKRLDGDDAAYWSLELWADRNQDGYASAEERQSLADAGIASIDLDPAHLRTDTVAGLSAVKGVVATFADDSERTLWDIPLAVAAANPATATVYAAGIDKVTGSGQVALVAKSALGIRIDLNGSGADQGIGGVGDDTLVGTAGDDWLIGGAGADHFEGGDGRDLLVIDADDRQDDIDGGADIDTALVADDRGVLLNLAQANVEVVYGGYGNDVFIAGGADNYFISGAAGDDLIVGGSADDALSGEDGDDVVQGDAGDDLIRGHRGRDQLFGGPGNDVLDGGLDDDVIQGDGGNDVIVASGGRDTVDGGEGYDLIELQGGLEDYRFVQNADGGWTITDTRNADGSMVAEGLVSDRDGVQFARNVERFSYMRGSAWTTYDFAYSNPLPADDRIEVAATSSSHAISAASVLANDVDFQKQALSLYWVGDAIGGTVALSADKKTITFTPNPEYVGPLEFAYKVQDSQGNRAPTFTLVSDSSVFADAKGRVRLVPADAPSDPDYVQQWYLGVSGVPAVWDDYTGKGVKVLVLEPSGEFAIDRQAANLNHPDLIANKSIGFSDTRDYSTHATAVAGVIAAARNGVGGVGVAYDTEIDSIGLQPGTSVSRAAYRDDMNAMQRYDIVNNSWMHDNPWGHISFSDDTAFQHSLEMTAIQQAAARGRGGLGTVMVFGAGNDRSKAFDAGLSTLTANPYTITVGAINRVGDIGSGLGNNKPFSNRGANILVSAPGSNIFSSSVQIENANGSVFGSDAEEFQGTSFATPIVSGVAALMLEANPLLTYRDVQTILALTARKDFGPGVQTDSVWYRNSNAEWNGYGMHYSHDYGFGMVDARAAVRMAESWLSEDGQGTPSLTHVSNAFDAVPDNGKRILSFDVADKINVEHVAVNLQLDHPRWSDLVITLVSPTGTRSTLLDRAGVTDQGVHLTNPLSEPHLNKDLMSVHFRGEESVGVWHLEIEDKVTGMAGSGSILASLDVFGSNAGNTRRYVLTDEYSGGWNIIGAPVFQNELNAAAVSGNLRIDLSGTSASNIGGKSLIVSGGIDRLLGGDGHDTLLGATGNEAIHGARGNDTIDGGTGNDSLYGGDGHDSLSGGSGHDSLSGGDGNDTLFGGSGQDVLTTDSGLDFLWGGADADIFLIDGDIGGTAYIKDFMVGTGGDSLQIRTPNKLNWGGIVQTTVGTNLHVTYNTTGGQRTVVLEGVGTALDARSLRGRAF
jgi:Ca2+-binding RTX toxin-like protein